MGFNSLKILAFAPHSAIWVHAFPEALILESLQQSGHEILYITCSEEFQEYCICMSSYQLSQNSSEIEKKQVCYDCQQRKQILKEAFNFQGYDLGKVLTPKDYQGINHYLQSTNQNNFLDLVIEGIEIGRFALYELLLQYKKIDLKFSEEEWKNYQIALKNTLISFSACRKIIQEEKPDRIITYNSLYSVNNICCQLAKKSNIPVYFLHAGGNLSNRLETMWFGENSTFEFYQELLNNWHCYQDQPLSINSLEKVTNHFLELFKGKHFLVYSSPKQENAINIRERFKIDPHQKIIVASMSSYDERFAGESIKAIYPDPSLIFPTQIDWIKSLIHFFKTRKDLFLIIRVHPREFPNKRESRQSEHTKKLESLFTDLPENIKVNYPSDQLSLYDLVEETDLFLNAWSSVGEEMSLLGIPVIIYSKKLVFYPPDLNEIAHSEEDLYQKIDQVLARKWDFEKVRKAYRWYGLKFDRSVFYLSESISWLQEKPLKKLSIFDKIIHKIRYKLSQKYRDQMKYQPQQEDCDHRAKQLKEKEKINQLILHHKKHPLALPFPEENPISLEEETQAIKKELRRLLTVLYSEDHSSEQSSLKKKIMNSIQEL